MEKLTKSPSSGFTRLVACFSLWLVAGLTQLKLAPLFYLFQLHCHIIVQFMGFTQPAIHSSPPLSQCVLATTLLASLPFTSGIAVKKAWPSLMGASLSMEWPLPPQLPNSYSTLMLRSSLPGPEGFFFSLSDSLLKYHDLEGKLV